MIRCYLNGLLACTLLFLAACGGGSDADPIVSEPDEALSGFTEQEVSWEACDPNFFGPEFTELLAPIQDRLECATLKTPLDWANPELDEINLGVLRVRAGNEAERKGAILLNPGGPGGDGLIYGAIFGLVFASNGLTDFNYGTAAPEVFEQVSEQYDIVGFSPRGLGGSFQLFCGNNATLPPANFYTDRSAENVQALLDQGRLFAESCLNNPFAKYIDTEQTARDMNLIRQVLGDEKLNYLGYSYGTWLGAWYAKLFPQHAGNMVLDANVEFSTDWQKTDFDFVMGFQRAFEEVALPYVARNDAIYRLGGTADEVYGVYEGLPRELKGALVQGEVSIQSDLYVSAAVPDIAAKLVAAKGVQEVLQARSEPVTEENIEGFLSDLDAYTYSENEDVDEAAREAALILGEDYFIFLETGLERAAREVIQGPGDAVYTAVVCNDSPFNKDPNFWIQKGDELDQLYPLLGGGQTRQPCAFWPEPTTSMPDVPDDVPPPADGANGV